MATITLNIPDAAMPRVVDALCTVGGWVSLEVSGPRGAFAKSVVVDYLKSTVRDVEHQTLKQEALDAVVAPDVVDVT